MILEAIMINTLSGGIDADDTTINLTSGTSFGTFENVSVASTNQDTFKLVVSWYHTQQSLQNSNRVTRVDVRQFLMLPVIMFISMKIILSH